MKVISFINMKGGVAKTTLSVNVADCLTKRHGSKVLVVDIDPQFNATQCIMSGDKYVQYLEEENDTIVRVFDRAAYPAVGLIRGSAIKKPKNLSEITPYRTPRGFDLLPGALDLYRLEMSPGEGRENRLKNYLEAISSTYDYVIIDTPPTPSIWMTSALLASNYYLIPVKTDPISLTGIDLLHSIITEKSDNYGLSIKCCGLVFTIAEPTTTNYKNAVRSINASSRWKGKLYTNHLTKRTKVANEQLKQRYILDLDDVEIKRQLAGITGELIERIK